MCRDPNGRGTTTHTSGDYISTEFTQLAYSNLRNSRPKNPILYTIYHNFFPFRTQNGSFKKADVRIHQPRTLSNVLSFSAKQLSNSSDDLREESTEEFLLLLLPATRRKSLRRTSMLLSLVATVASSSLIMAFSESSSSRFCFNSFSYLRPGTD